MRAVLRKYKDPQAPDEDVWGYTVFNEGLIYLRRVTARFPKHAQMQAFWHEYFHAVLHHAGRERMKRDETLVDCLGTLQLQALNTMKF